jgi:phosphatidate cytidylyltransferase
MVEPVPKPSGELQTRAVIGVALITLAVGALVAGGFIFWMLAALAGVLMQGEWADLAKAPDHDKRLSMFAICVPLAIMAPLAAGPSYLAIGLLAGAFLFVTVIGQSPRLGAGVFYAGLPILALLFLRDRPDGLLLTFWALGLVWMTDIGAYFAGRCLGGPKLAPGISPSKTWSGLGGGVLAALLFGFILHDWLGLPLPLAAASGLLAIIAQLGDLYESWLKRRAGVKDSSSLLPGHGGVLDRLDGVVTVAPVAALLVASGYFV